MSKHEYDGISTESSIKRPPVQRETGTPRPVGSQRAISPAPAAPGILGFIPSSHAARVPVLLDIKDTHRALQGIVHGPLRAHHRINIAALRSYLTNFESANEFCTLKGRLAKDGCLRCIRRRLERKGWRLALADQQFIADSDSVAVDLLLEAELLSRFWGQRNGKAIIVRHRAGESLGVVQRLLDAGIQIVVVGVLECLDPSLRQLEHHPNCRLLDLELDIMCVDLPERWLRTFP